MAEVLKFNEKPEPKAFSNNHVDSNVDYARLWYKQKKWLPGMKVRVGTSGSSSAGTIKNGTLYISYQGEFGSKAPSLCQTIFTGSPVSIFKNELENVYSIIYEHAERYNKIQNNK